MLCNEGFRSQILDGFPWVHHLGQNTNLAIGVPLRFLLLLLLIASPLLSHGPEDLPQWAVGPSLESLATKAPDGADAWILLQRNEFVYSGDGEYQRRQMRLVRVITERGKGEAAFALAGFGGKTGKVRKLQGWNLRPDGELVRLDSDDVLTFSGDREASFSTRTVTTARLSGVVPGSLVAFECIEKVRLPLGPADILFPMEEHPVRRWELSASVAPGWFNSAPAVKVRLGLLHFNPWISQVSMTADSIVAMELPPVPAGEQLHPHEINSLPMVSVAFLDRGAANGPSLASWDDLARWIQRSYQARFQPIKPVEAPAGPPGGALASILDWMNRELLYKQVYLTPERGWLPESSEEVVRRRYGDCKDLSACFSGAAIAAGFEPHPVLARISEGALEVDSPVNPYLFNHVITAIRLKDSMNLPAEVETPRGRFLLVDPTSRLTPFGLLPPDHRAGRVMICLEEGAQWVDIPARAIQAQILDITLKGNIDPSGTLEGEVQIAEQGEAASLRGTIKFGNPLSLKERVIHLLGLTASADLNGISVKNAEVLEAPLEVSARVRIPLFMTRTRGESVLRQTGFPGLPPLLPREAPARLYPLESISDLQWRLHLELDLPAPMQLLSSARQIDTPFRTASWSAKVLERHLSAVFLQAHHDAKFDHSSKNEGLQLARKDRRQLHDLLEEATSLKETPR